MAVYVWSWLLMGGYNVAIVMRLSIKDVRKNAILNPDPVRMSVFVIIWCNIVVVRACCST